MAEDAEAIAALPYVDSAAPTLTASGTLRHGGTEALATINGVGWQFFRVRGTGLIEGDAFSAQHVQQLAQVAVIDAATRDGLFPHQRHVVGEVIVVGGVPVMILGVAKPESGMVAGASLNIWVPYTTATGRLGNSKVNSLTLRLRADVDGDTAEAGIAQLLVRRHGIKGFFLSSSDAIRQMIEKTTRSITLLISSIAVISLLVGGTASAAKAVRDILQEAEAPNTTRSYAGALRYWAGWFVGRYGKSIALPVPPAAVVQFIVDHMGRAGEAGLRWDLPADLDHALVAAGLKKRPGSLAFSSLVHRVAVLSAAHKQARQLNPCEDRAVRTLLSKGRRASHKRGERPAKKAALLAADVRAMAATCDDSLKGKRDRALLYFAFASGGRRRSEVADATLANLSRLPEGGFTYLLDSGKTLQAGPAAGGSPDKPILGEAAQALQDWLQAADIVDGPIFRRVWPRTIGGALSGKAVATIVKDRARLAGLEGDFGGHSLRSGFVTEGAQRGIALPALMAMTDHRSVASIVGYYQAGGTARNPAANLLDSLGPPNEPGDVPKIRGE